MRSRLRAALEDPGLLIAPGCHDVISARIVEESGFKAAFLGSSLISIAHFGKPNIGEIGLTETISYAANLVDMVDIPLLVATGTGFGDRAIDLRRTARQFERMGVAGIFIFDQAPTWQPCPEGAGPLLPVESGAARIAAAREGIAGTDCLLIATTYALASEPIGAVIDRMKAYVDAGADLVQPALGHGPVALRDHQLADLRAIVDAVPVPVVINTPHGLGISIDEATRAGAKVYIMPQLTLGHATAAVHAAVRALAEGRLAEYSDDHPPHPVRQLSELARIQNYEALAR